MFVFVNVTRAYNQGFRPFRIPVAVSVKYDLLPDDLGSFIDGNSFPLYLYFFFTNSTQLKTNCMVLQHI